MKNNTTLQQYLIGSLFFIAMGILEAAVVVYLRHIYYPDGFQFPLVSMETSIVGVELVRELATLVMLATVAVALGNRRHARLGWFFIGFGIWDIIYYVFLKIWLNWPASLFTQDVLFLLPVAWIGPVYSPILLSVLLITLGHYLVKFNSGKDRPLDRFEWILLILGSLVCLVAFTKDSFYFICKHLQSGSTTTILEAAMWPKPFADLLFLTGAGIILMGIIAYRFRMKRIQTNLEHAQWM